MATPPPTPAVRLAPGARSHSVPLVAAAALGVAGPHTLQVLTHSPYGDTV